MEPTEEDMIEWRREFESTARSQQMLSEVLGGSLIVLLVVVVLFL